MYIVTKDLNELDISTRNIDHDVVNDIWILANGIWNNDGIWTNNGIWNFNPE